MEGWNGFVTIFALWSSESASPSEISSSYKVGSIDKVGITELVVGVALTFIGVKDVAELRKVGVLVTLLAVAVAVLMKVASDVTKARRGRNSFFPKYMF